MSDNGDAPRVDGRRLRYQNRRGEILTAVMAHVLEHGINQLSFRKLAAAVGVSHVTLRHHFGTKDDLLVEILGSIGSRTPIPENLGDADIEAVIQGLWQRWMQPATDQRSRLLFEAYGLAVRNPDEYRAFLDRVTTGWINMLRHHALRAGCPSDEVDDFATLLLAQVRGLQFDLLATDDRARLGSAIDSVIDGIRQQRARWAELANR
nr:TetR/AcrR family transcriptional regulator [Mycobacterium spongiae]